MEVDAKGQIPQITGFKIFKCVNVWILFFVRQGPLETFLQASESEIDFLLDFGVVHGDGELSKHSGLPVEGIFGQSK